MTQISSVTRGLGDQRSPISDSAIMTAMGDITAGNASRRMFTTTFDLGEDVDSVLQKEVT